MEPNTQTAPQATPNLARPIVDISPPANSASNAVASSVVSEAPKTPEAPSPAQAQPEPSVNTADATTSTAESPEKPAETKADANPAPEKTAKKPSNLPYGVIFVTSLVLVVLCGLAFMAYRSSL